MSISKYETIVKPRLPLIKKWVRNDLSDQEIWTLLKIAKSSFYDYKKKYIEFAEALQKNSEYANAEVENQLLQNCLGYEFVEETTGIKKEIIYEDGKKVKEISETISVPLKKYKQSETNAIKFWLPNKDSENWRERQEVNLSGKNGAPISIKLEDVL